MKFSLPTREQTITRVIKGTGYSAILFVLLIFFFLAREGLPAINSRVFSKLFGIRWYPIENYFGLLPLIAGSLIVTVGAALVAVPLGIGTAVFIREVAPHWSREILKPLIEVLAGLPSVVLGFIGILVLSPMVRTILNLPTGLESVIRWRQRCFLPKVAREAGRAAEAAFTR